MTKLIAAIMAGMFSVAVANAYAVEKADEKKGDTMKKDKKDEKKDKKDEKKDGDKK